MSWLSRRVKQSLRAMKGDMADGHHSWVDGRRRQAVARRRYRPVVRNQRRTDFEIQRIMRGKPLLHKGRKP